MLICVVTVCTLLYNYAYTHGLPMPFSLKSIIFGRGQTNWADEFWGIWGIFGRFISTYDKVKSKSPSRLVTCLGL